MKAKLVGVGRVVADLDFREFPDVLIFGFFDVQSDCSAHRRIFGFSFPTFFHFSMFLDKFV